ncbi:MAG: caspase family protein, partial [Promethearchaeota archaeon]
MPITKRMKKLYFILGIFLLQLCFLSLLQLDVVKNVEKLTPIALPAPYELDSNITDKNQSELSIPSSSTELNPREAYALVCGVEDYPGTDSDLAYCNDDAVDLRYLFENEFNIPAENIQTLTDSNANEAQILEELAKYAEILDDNDVFLFTYSGHGTPTVDLNSYSHTINSPHPYSNNYDGYWYISEPGVDAIRVHFTRIETETGYDGVFIGDGDETDYYYDLFTGSYTDVWSYWIPTDYLYVNLYTDYSYTYWGFEIDMYETLEMGAPYGLYPYSDDDEALLTGNELKSSMDLIPGTQICILDSCHSGGVGSDLVDSNRMVICACEATEYSLEDPANQNGVFTGNFISSWNYDADTDGNYQISIEEVFTECYSDVVSRSTALGYPHHPVIYDNIPGHVYLTPSFNISDFTQYGNQISISGHNYGLGFVDAQLSLYNIVDATMITITIPTDGIQGVDGVFTDYEFTLDDSIDLRTYDYHVISWKNPYAPLESGFLEVSTGREIDESINFISQVNEFYPDFDGDGLPDLLEIALDYSPSLRDSNGNGVEDGAEDIDMDNLNNSMEILEGTNILIDDTDGDGILDGDEVFEYSTDPLDVDTDGDGITDYSEIFIYSSNPLSEDTDSDGIEDRDEIELYFTNILSNDTDDDGLTDYEEIHQYETDPREYDTDGDGYSDFEEIQKGTNPLSKINNPASRTILILSVVGLIGSVAWVTKGRYIYRDRHEAKKRKQILQKKVTTINDALKPSRQSLNSSHLQFQIKRLQQAYALENPSILLDNNVIKNCTLLNSFYKPSIESCRDSKWVWHNSHFNDPNIFTRNDPLLVMAAPFANTLTNELQLFNKHYLPFSISNLRTVLGIAKAKYEFFHEEEREEEIFSENSRYLEVLTQKPDFILSSHIETGKNLEDYSEFVNKLDNYWNENKYLSLHTLVYSQKHKKEINYNHLKVLAWSSQLSLDDDFFKKILPEKYGNFDTLGELIQKVTEENPTISKEYLDHFQETL